MSSGILCVDKPRGLTSHDVVDFVRRMIGQPAVGHTGTLDPDASGLMLLCLGRATKFARFFEGLDKTYWTVMKIGECTDTQDATGRLTRQCPVPSLSLPQIRAILSRFTGHLQQTPPMYSAVKHQGQRLYHLARQGRTVARQARDVYIHRLELLDLRDAQATFSVTCSKGTYIRTLCEDIGMALGYGAHMMRLQRAYVGSFCLKDAYALDYLEHKAQKGGIRDCLMPLTRALDFLPALSLTSQQYQTLQAGQGSALSTILRTLPGSTTRASCYRLRTIPRGTFAVIHRRTTGLDKWKLSYLETP